MSLCNSLYVAIVIALNVHNDVDLIKILHYFSAYLEKVNYVPIYKSVRQGLITKNDAGV